MLGPHIPPTLEETKEESCAERCAPSALTVLSVLSAASLVPWILSWKWVHHKKPFSLMDYLKDKIGTKGLLQELILREFPPTSHSSFVFEIIIQSHHFSCSFPPSESSCTPPRSLSNSWPLSLSIVLSCTYVYAHVFLNITSLGCIYVRAVLLDVCHSCDTWNKLYSGLHRTPQEGRWPWGAGGGGGEAGWGEGSRKDFQWTPTKVNCHRTSQQQLLTETSDLPFVCLFIFSVCLDRTSHTWGCLFRFCVSQVTLKWICS